MAKLKQFAVAAYNCFTDVNTVEIIEATSAKVAILKHSTLTEFELDALNLEEVLEVIRNCDHTVGYLDITPEGA